MELNILNRATNIVAQYLRKISYIKVLDSRNLLPSTNIKETTIYNNTIQYYLF